MSFHTKFVHSVLPTINEMKDRKLSIHIELRGKNLKNQVKKLKIRIIYYYYNYFTFVYFIHV